MKRESTEPKKVLCALDFGDASLEALRQARGLAHGVGGRLAACHVLRGVHDLGLLFPVESMLASADTVAENGTVEKALGEHTRSKLGLELTEIFVERGAPYAELVRRAELWGADFIAVGSHGKSGLARLVLGSVAERVVSHAHCSVLVARPVRRPGVVLVATDLSDPSLPAITAGAEAAERSGARLVVLSVLEWSGFAAAPLFGMLGALPQLPPAELQKQMSDALQTLLNQSMERLGVVGKARVVDGSAASEIVSLADELDAELLVVGTHGRTGLTRLALGSVAERVIRGASCSVLAVRLAAKR